MIRMCIQLFVQIRYLSDSLRDSLVGVNTRGSLNAQAELAIESFPMHVLTLDLWCALCKRLLKKKKKNQTPFPGTHRAKKDSKTVESLRYFQGAVPQLCVLLKSSNLGKATVSRSALCLPLPLPLSQGPKPLKSCRQMCVNNSRVGLAKFLIKESSSPGSLPLSPLPSAQILSLGTSSALK